jgi:hypothetical protein
MLAAASAYAPAAHSQSTGLIPVRAKVGAFLPQSSGKDFAGSTNFIVEGDVAIPNLSAGKIFVSAGYSQGSNNGNKMRVIPITIGRYFAAPNPLASVTGNVYGGLGAGAYLVRASTPVSSESKTTIGGFGVVGYQFPSKFFVEAKYHIAGKVNGARPSGLAIMVGRSF